MLEEEQEKSPEDLVQLSALFAPKPKIPKLKFRRLRPLIEQPRRPLTEADLRRMYKLRHGSESLADIDQKFMNYNDIAKRLHIPKSTVHWALTRYEQ